MLNKLIKLGKLPLGLLDPERKPTPLLHYALLLLIALQLALVGYCKITLYQKSFVTSDGALFANMLWNTNFVDKFLYTHYRDISWGIQTYLGDHFSPTLLVIAPIYHLLPSPLTLVIAQTIMPGIACGLIYWFGLKILKNQLLSFLIAISYLFLPSIILGTIDDVYGFHHDSLIPPLILLAYLFLVERKTLPYLAVLILAMGMKENLPLVGILLGAEMVLYGLLKSNRFFVKTGATTLALAIAFAFAGLWLAPRLFGSPPRYALQVFTALAQGNFGDPTVPLYWIGVVVVFLPALLAPEVLVLAIPDLISVIAMEYPPYDWHIYTPATIIAIACIIGVSRLLRATRDQSPPVKEKEYLTFIPASLQEKTATVLRHIHPSQAYFVLIAVLMAVAIHLQYPTPRNVFSFGQEIGEVLRTLLHFLFRAGAVLMILMIGNWLLRWVKESKLLLAASLLPMIVAIGLGGMTLQEEIRIIQSLPERVNLNDVKPMVDLIPPDSRLATTSDLLIYFTNRTYLLWPNDPQAEFMLVNDNAIYDYDIRYVEELKAMLAAQQVEILASSGKITLYQLKDSDPATQP